MPIRCGWKCRSARATCTAPTNTGLPRTGPTSRESGRTGRSAGSPILSTSFTPKGALYQLPKGATPIDFAYGVHTDLGSAAVGAKINGRHVPLRTPLANGDVVEIIKSRSSQP